RLPANNPLPDVPRLPEIPLTRGAPDGRGNMVAPPLEYQPSGAEERTAPVVQMPRGAPTGRTPAPPPAPPLRGPSQDRPRVDNPCVRAAVCYVVPLLPALGLLIRERSDRFVRLHAAQALVFFVLLATAQLALYAALVLLGGGVPPDGPLATALGLVFYALVAALGLGSLLLWLALL